MKVHSFLTNIHPNLSQNVKKFSCSRHIYQCLFELTLLTLSVNKIRSLNAGLGFTDDSKDLKYLKHDWVARHPLSECFSNAWKRLLLTNRTKERTIHAVGQHIDEVDDRKSVERYCASPNAFTVVSLKPTWGKGDCLTCT